MNIYTGLRVRYFSSLIVNLRVHAASNRNILESLRFAAITAVICSPTKHLSNMPELRNVRVYAS